MESKKINQLATEMSPAASDLTIIGDPITGVSKKITLEQISSLFSSSISFYSNYASFPATGSIDTLYCAKDTNKLYLWNGSAYVQTFPSQALLDTYQLRSEKGAVNGYASLDGSGKVPVSQLPSSIMEYKGMWNAATNTPTLANGTGDTGDVYICNVAGTVNFGAGAITFAVGDYVIYSGSIWQRSSGAVGTVTSVAVTESSAALSITGSPITTSGTINIGFAGTSAQYVAGNGSLVTFPSLTGYVPYTGATADVNLGAFDLYTSKVWLFDNPNSAYGSMELTDGVLHFEDADGHSMVTMEDGYLTIANASTIRALLNVSALTANRDYAFPNASGTLALTSDIANFSVVAPLAYFGGVLSMPQSSGSQNGYLSSTDWTTFNGKQTQLNGTGFVKASGTTITYDNSTYLTTSAAASTYVPYTGATMSVDITGNNFSSSNIKINGDNTSNFGFLGFKQYSGGSSGQSGYTSIFAQGTNKINIGFSSTGSNKTISFLSDLISSNTTREYSFPDASGTIALTSNLSSYLPLSGGTLTGALNGTSAVFSSSVTATNSIIVDSATIAETRLRGGGYGSSYNTSLRSIAGGIGVLQFGNNADNYILAGNTAAGGYLSIRVNCASESISAGIEAMRITSGGNVGIGTSSPDWLLKIEKNSSTGGGGTYPALVVNNPNAAGYSAMYFFNGSTNVGGLEYSNSSTNLSLNAYGALLFQTASGTERMRITSGGQILFGSTSTPYNSALFRSSYGSNTYFSFGPNNNSNSWVLWNDSGTGVYLTSGNSSWSSASDERLKNINSNIDNAVQKLMTLRAVNYSWKSDKTNKENLGLIAQDVQKVFPEVIDISKGFIENDETEYLSVKYTELIPVLIAAIQEQQKQIDELKNK